MEHLQGSMQGALPRADDQQRDATRDRPCARAGLGDSNQVVPGVSRTKFDWEDAIPMLQAGPGAVRVRPAHLLDAECCQGQVFLENPVLRRRKGDDKRSRHAPGGWRRATTCG